MSLQSLNDRQKAFFLLGLLADQAHLAQLISLLPPPDQVPLSRALETVKPASKEAKRELVVDELKRLSGKGRLSPISTIHPDWIVEALLRESPRMIGTILRHLPGNQVRVVLETLSESVLSRMPPLAETFSLDPELVQILKRRFEQHFAHLPFDAAQATGRSFESLPFLPGVKLELLFRDAGFAELAMAFSTLSEKMISVILKRLPPRDSALLKLKMEKGSPVSDERQKQAQAHLLSLDVEKSAGENLVLELGFFIYSKALLPTHLEGARVVQQKFPLLQGRLLKRYVEKNLPLNSEATVTAYQRELTDTLQELEGGM